MHGDKMDKLTVEQMERFMRRLFVGAAPVAWLVAATSARRGSSTLYRMTSASPDFMGTSGGRSACVKIEDFDHDS